MSTEINSTSMKCHYLDLGSASDMVENFLQPTKSTTQTWVQWHAICMEFRQLFLRQHFMWKRMVALWNVDAFWKELEKRNTRWKGQMTWALTLKMTRCNTLPNIIELPKLTEELVKILWVASSGHLIAYLCWIMHAIVMVTIIILQ